MREEQCRYIIEIAQAGSVNKAAENLFISQQSLSRALNSVESELGVRIFARDARGVKLTADGEEVLRRLHVIVGCFDELHAYCSGAQEPPVSDRHFTIYVTPYIRNPLLNVTLPRLMKRFPNVSFSVAPCAVTAVRAEHPAPGFYLLATGDTALCDKLSPDWLSQSFYEDRTCIAVSAGHKLAHYKSVALQTALKYPFAIFQGDDDASNPFMEWCNLQHLPINVKLRTDHLATYLRAIASGDMIGPWPEISAHIDEVSSDHIKLLALAEPLYFPVHGIVQRDFYEENRDIVDVFGRLIRQYLT